ncbi:MAG: WG repeat-containing protein [Saprospiraceae bacterium]
MKPVFLFLFFSLTALLSAQTNTFFPFEKDGQWGIVDQQGKVTLPPTFKKLSFFRQPRPALAISIATDGMRQNGLVDQNGQVLLAFQQQDLRFSNLDYCVWVVRNGKWGAFDALSKKMVVPASYDTLMTIFEDKEHLFAKKGARYFVYSISGKLEKKESEDKFQQRIPMVFVPPVISRDVDEYALGLDLDKEFTLDEPIRAGGYVYRLFHNQQHLYGLLDFDGIVVMDCKYEQLIVETPHNHFADRFILIKQNALWGIFQTDYDTNGYLAYFQVMECQSMVQPVHIDVDYPGKYTGDSYYLVVVNGADNKPVKGYYHVPSRKLFVPSL